MIHFARAALALAAALTFSLPSFGQSPSTHRMGTLAHAPVAAAPPDGSVTRAVQRYKTPDPNKDWLAAWTEYTYPDCTPDGPGQWSYSNATTNTGQISQGTIQGTLANGDCPGKTFTFASIYYKWTAHNNHSVMVNAAGPTDRFTATWIPPTNDVSQEKYTFTLTVPVVRPKGEYAHFTNWDPAAPYLGATAVYWMTLKCCAPSGANGAAGDGGGDSDSKFDFSGEQLEEEITAVTPNKPECAAGWPPEGHTSVGAGNKWGVDHVGWNACAGPAVARCAKIAPCSFTFTQEMRIRSPADSGYTKYSTNTQGSTIEAGTIGPAPNTNKVTQGNVTSYRGGAVAPPNNVTTNLAMCPNLAAVKCTP